MTAMIRDMTREEKPREKFAARPEEASMVDLVAILLRTGTKGASVLDVARQVVELLEGGRPLSGYAMADWRDLVDIPGIGKDKAVTVCAAIELGRRLARRHEKRRLDHMSDPGKVAALFMERLRHENQEHFHVCYLNGKNRFLGEREITVGTMDASLIDVKEIFLWALRFKAQGLIAVHNHPSGFPEPSEDDLAATEKIRDGARLLDMELRDHIIIGDGVYVSLHERGFL